MITVLNATKFEGKYDLVLYCGRSASYLRAKQLIGDSLIDCSKLFGNYSPGRTLASFVPWFNCRVLQGKQTYDWLDRLAKRHAKENIVLVCWCKPKSCHCDFIASKAECLRKLTYWTEEEMSWDFGPNDRANGY